MRGPRCSVEEGLRRIMRCALPFYRPSGVRRSIHSSASARVRSASGLPMRFSSRSTPFSPRHSTASVLRRSTWLLRALPDAPLREELAGAEDSSVLPLSSAARDARAGASLAREPRWALRIGVGRLRWEPGDAKLYAGEA